MSRDSRYLDISTRERVLPGNPAAIERATLPGVSVISEEPREVCEGEREDETASGHLQTNAARGSRGIARDDERASIISRVHATPRFFGGYGSA